jgi:hypothetical protein
MPLVSGYQSSTTKNCTAIIQSAQCSDYGAAKQN